MNGTISRLIDNAQTGAISGEDGREYPFEAAAVRDTTFGSLALGARVTFAPVETFRGWRADTVRLRREPSRDAKPGTK
jgi:hypothetical protein